MNSRFALSSASMRALAASALLLVSSSAYAQTESPADATPKEAAQKGNKVDLNIGSGTKLAELISWLGLKYPGTNFVVSPAVAETPVTELKLRNVGLEDTLKAICIATDSQVEWSLSTPGDASSTPVYSLQAAGKSRPAEKSNQEVRAFYVRDYLRSLAADLPKARNPQEAEEIFEKLQFESIMRLREIIFATADVFFQRKNGRKPEPSAQQRMMFDFHQQTGLCIIIAPPEDMEIASEILSALPGARSSGGPRSGATSLGLPRSTTTP